MPDSMNRRLAHSRGGAGLVEDIAADDLKWRSATWYSVSAAKRLILFKLATITSLPVPIAPDRSGQHPASIHELCPDGAFVQNRSREVYDMLDSASDPMDDSYMPANVSPDPVENNKATVRRMLKRLSVGDIAGFTEALAPNYVRHCQSMP